MKFALLLVALSGVVAAASSNSTTPTPAPTPIRQSVTVLSTVTGFTLSTFDATAQRAYRSAFAVQNSVSLGDVTITGVVATAAARRRQLAAGLQYDVVTQVSDAAAASALASSADASKAAMASKFTSALQAAGITVPAGMTVTPASAVVAQVTTAPTPAPTPVPPPFPAYVPTTAVKTMMRYMERVNPKLENYKQGTYNGKATVRAATKLGAVATALGVTAILCFLLFLFCHKCCKACKCCYRAHLSEDHHYRSKLVMLLMVLLTLGLSCGTVKGRDSFHLAADVVGDQVAAVATMLSEMEGAATAMGTESAAMRAAADTLTTCPASVCSACPYPGAAPPTKAQWDSAAHTTISAEKGKLNTGISGYKDAGAMLLDILAPGGKSLSADLRKISDQIKTGDGKKYIDAGIAFTIALAFLVCFPGLLGVFCLSNKSRRKSCVPCVPNLSTLLIGISLFLGFAVLVLLVVLVAIEVSASGLFSDVCGATNPLGVPALKNPVERAFISTVVENDMGLDAANAERLTFYFTCEGNDAVAEKLQVAQTAFETLGAPLAEMGKNCDTAALAAELPKALTSLGAIENAMACPRINAILLGLTRNAVCTHMVDGLYFLWVVQACVGVFLIIALVVMRLVQMSFFVPQGDDAAAANGKAVAQFTKTGKAVAQGKGVEMTSITPSSTAANAKRIKHML